MMFAVRDLGEYISKRYNKDALEAFVSDLGKTEYIFLVTLKDKGNTYEYNGIEVEKYDSGEYLKYLYRKTSANAPYATPTAPVPGGSIDAIKKTFTKKIVAWFGKKNIAPILKRLNEKGVISTEEIESVYAIGEIIKAKETQILNDLLEKYKDYKGASIVLSVAILRENDEISYLADIPLFKEVLKEVAKKRYYEKYGTQSIAEKQQCSVCGETKEEVFGFLSDIFPFYTLDKSGFAPDFDKQNGWKLYPVCYDCATYLEFGKRFLDERLNLRFYGNFPFYLIPKFLFGVNDEVIDVIENWGNPTFAEKEKEKYKPLSQLFYDEDYLIYTLGELGDYVSFTFLFYKTEQQALRVLFAATDVLPSRLMQLYKAKQELEKEFPYKDANMKFNFKLLRNIFPSDKMIGVFDNYFIDTAGRIIMGRQLNYDFLIKHIIDRIRERFVKLKVASYSSKEYYPYQEFVLGHFMFLKYASKLNLLNLKKEVDEEMSNTNTELSGDKIVEQAESFFSMNPEFFDSDAKKAIFLMGILTQKLLDIQYQDRQATPFMSKLNGLKLSQRLIVKLLPEVQNKLEEYGKNYYRELEDKIAEYFVKAGNAWRMSNDEISFYFVIGMNMSRRFRNKKEESENNEED